MVHLLGAEFLVNFRWDPRKVSFLETGHYLSRGGGGGGFWLCHYTYCLPYPPNIGKQDGTEKLAINVSLQDGIEKLAISVGLQDGVEKLAIAGGRKAGIEKMAITVGLQDDRKIGNKYVGLQDGIKNWQ